MGGGTPPQQGITAKPRRREDGREEEGIRREEETRSAKAAKGQRAQRKRILELGVLCLLAALAHFFVIRRGRVWGGCIRWPWLIERQSESVGWRVHPPALLCDTGAVAQRPQRPQRAQRGNSIEYVLYSSVLSVASLVSVILIVEIGAGHMGGPPMPRRKRAARTTWAGRDPAAGCGPRTLNP
jgi:hypothetical protein